VDGVSDFNALHSGKHNDEVQLYAFDILALDGDDLRALPLSLRKTNLALLLARRPDGIFVAPFEQGEIGPDLFRAAGSMGLEGLGIEAPRSAVSSRPVAELDQDQEPQPSGDGAGDGVIQMTTLGKLLAEKQKLIERLQEEVGPEERDEIERLLENIDAALDSLDKAGPGPSKVD
jgi:hypothetical protein